jgi:hypothetical protein
MTTTVEPSIWEARAADLSVDGRAVIANRSVDARSARRSEAGEAREQLRKVEEE